MRRIQKRLFCFVFLISLALLGLTSALPFAARAAGEAEEPKDESLIKWVDMNISCKAMQKAIALDCASRDKPVHLNFIALLACLAVKNGNNFSAYKDAQLDNIAQKLSEGKSAAELSGSAKYYAYYFSAFEAIFAGFVGDYEIEIPNDDGKSTHWEKRYGLKVFSPIARGYYFSHCDDFGKKRSYGFARPHLGNDLIGNIGTPIIAVEGGVVEALGWNQYGGWRIGIRSFDSKRYYYYAHLRKDFPFQKDLKVGSLVASGDVIGYLGRTGYSIRENVNNISTAHLHFGMQLIFDESQKECLSEIWIDVYQIVELIKGRQSVVVREPETGDYRRLYGFRDLSGYTE